MSEIDPSGNGSATGPTDDATLNQIAAWCDENGWDELGTPAFFVWVDSQGIDRSKLMIHKCGAKCAHVWDGPIVEDGGMMTTTCSKCGEWAINDAMRNAP